MKRAITYIRVSTAKQGKSGLGLEAQEEIIQRFCKNHGFETIDSFIDVESGKDSNREGLNKAIIKARNERATIIVAKLDRLSRSVHFISGLMEEGVPFLVAELGKEVPSFMLHIYASLAEMERKMIGKRTKEALAQAKKRGVKLGASIPAVEKAARKANKERGDRTYHFLLPHIKEAIESGCNSNRTIADYLNRKGIQTPRGKTFSKASMTPYLKRMREEERVEGGEE